MGGGGRADPAEAVGRWGGDPGAEGVEQFPGQRLGRDPQPHRARPAGDGVGHVGGPGQDQRERAGPEGLGQGPGVGRHLGRPGLDGGRLGQVDDDGVVPGAALDGEDPGHGGGVGGVGP